jgi:hypothetical protein
MPMLRTSYGPTDVTSDVGGAMGARGGGGALGGLGDYTGLMGEVIKRKLGDMNLRRQYEAQDRRQAARDRMEARAQQRTQADIARRRGQKADWEHEQERLAKRAEEQEKQPMRWHPGGPGFTSGFYTPETQGLTGRQRKKFLPQDSTMQMGPDEARAAGAQARGAEAAEFEQFGRSSAERIGRGGGLRTPPKTKKTTHKKSGDVEVEESEGW